MSGNISIDNDFIFFQQIIKSYYKSLEKTANKVEQKFRIPSVSFCSSGNVSYWLAVDYTTPQPTFKNLDENYLKYKILYAYYMYTGVSYEELMDLADYNPYSEGSEKAIYNDRYKILFMIRMNFEKKGIYYYFVTKFILEEIKNTEYASKVDCVYGIKSNDRPLHFYTITMQKKTVKDEEFLYDIKIFNPKAKHLNYDDWKSKQEACLELNPHSVVKNDKCYRIKDVGLLNRLKSATNEVLRVIRIRTDIDLLELRVEFAQNFENLLYQIDVKNIKVWDKADDRPTLLQNINYECNFPIKKKLVDHKVKCSGIYCDHRDDSLLEALADQKKPIDNTYLLALDGEVHYKVCYKSIILDLIERHKTYERIKKNCSDMSRGEVDNLPEVLVYKFRKYYTIPDIHKFNMFNHLNYTYLYSKRFVCGYCKGMYDKLDYLRIMNKNTQNIFLKTKSLIPLEIDKIKTEPKYNMYKRQHKDKKILSEQFYIKMSELFQIPKEVPKKINTTIPDDLLDRFHKSQKRKKIQSSIQKSEDGNQTNNFFSEKENKLPELFIKKKNNHFLKQHLGTDVEEEKYHEFGSITNKTSFKMAKLQNRINKLEKISSKYNKGQFNMPRGEFMDLIMCPYQGNGKKDTKNLKSMLQKERDSNTLKNSQTDTTRLNLTQDSLNYRDTSTIRDKSDGIATKRLKERKEKEQNNKKSKDEQKMLLKYNSHLAHSVCKYFDGEDTSRIENRVSKSNEITKFQKSGNKFSNLFNSKLNSSFDNTLNTNKKKGVYKTFTRQETKDIKFTNKLMFN